MKTDLRIKAKEIRKSLPIEKISEELVEAIRLNKFYRNAKNVMIFYPKKYEIDLRFLLNDDKNFYLPRVNGKVIEVCPFHKGDELKMSKFNVLEPISCKIASSILDLIIVPALLVDKNNYRLGYGGGFYDRLLSEVEGKVKTLCLMPKELCVEYLPTEDFDRQIDKIILTK